MHTAAEKPLTGSTTTRSNFQSNTNVWSALRCVGRERATVKCCNLEDVTGCAELSVWLFVSGRANVCYVVHRRLSSDMLRPSALCSIPDSFTAKKIEEFGAALSKGAKGKERLSRGGFPDINYFH